MEIKINKRGYITVHLEPEEASKLRSFIRKIFDDIDTTDEEEFIADQLQGEIGNFKGD